MKGKIMKDYNFDDTCEQSVDVNDYIEYYLKRQDKIFIASGKIIKKLTRNLYIVNDLQTGDNYKINKSDIIEKIIMKENTIENKIEKIYQHNLMLNLFAIYLIILYSTYYIYYYIHSNEPMKMNIVLFQKFIFDNIVNYVYILFSQIYNRMGMLFVGSS